MWFAIQVFTVGIINVGGCVGNIWDNYCKFISVGPLLKGTFLKNLLGSLLWVVVRYYIHQGVEVFFVGAIEMKGYVSLPQVAPVRKSLQESTVLTLWRSTGRIVLKFSKSLCQNFSSVSCRINTLSLQKFHCIIKGYLFADMYYIIIL